MAMPTKLTPKKREEFLFVLAETGSVTVAAREIAMNRQYMYEVRKKDEAFSEAWDEAAEIGRQNVLEVMEEECDRRALKGVAKDVYYQGTVVGQVREYSDALLMFRMKRLDPRYARHVLGGDKETPLVLELTTE